MKIGSFTLGERVLVVAEIGNNHEGDIAVAEQLVREAARAGANAVKFQTFQTAHFVRRSDRARFERMSRFELSPQGFARLRQLAHEEGLLFVSTPLDLPSAKTLANLVDAFKIASGDNTFYPLLDAVAATRRPVIVSTGVTDDVLVRDIKSYLEERWEGDSPGLAFLHCVSCYPAPAEQLHLRNIPALVAALGCPIGYSDHTLGNEACLAAVALGAQIIEKHFTLDKHFSDFRDHQLSAEPAEFAQLVASIRAVSSMLGGGVKGLRPCEESMAPAIRRSIVAAAAFEAGHRLGLQDLSWLRPAEGLAPGQEASVVGRVLRRSVEAGQVLTPDLLD
jgi:N,N'-diacetyllegionaminate synthase